MSSARPSHGLGAVRSPAAAVNLVHEAQASIARAFGCQTSYDQRLAQDSLSKLEVVVSPQTPVEACLAPTLLLLGWTGDARRIREAMPHLARVRDIHGLRSVLMRLGYRTVRVRTTLARIGRGSLPCLYARDDETIILVAGREPDGRFLEFVSELGDWRYHRPGRRKETVYLLSEIDSNAAPETRWFEAAIGRFSPLIWTTFLLSFLVNLAALAVPLFTIAVFDFGIGSRSRDTVYTLAIGSGLIIAASLILRNIRASLLAYFGARLDSIVSISTFQKMLGFPLSVIETASLGGQISRLRQFESMREIFTSALAAAITDIPFILLFLAALAWWGGHLVWVPIVLMLIFAGLHIGVLPALRRRREEAENVRQELQRLVLEIVGSRDVLRAIGGEDVWIARHRALLHRWTTSNRTVSILNGYVQTVTQALVNLAGLGTLVLGTLWVINGAMTPGALIGSMAIVWRIMAPIQTTFLSACRLEEAVQTARHIDRMMRLPEESGQSRQRHYERTFQGGVTVQRLFIKYPRRAEPALRGLSVDIAPGEVVAVTGPSGAGKTTLLKAILGLHAPSAGAVLIDRLDLRQIATNEWRSAVSYLPERVDLFYGTVAQNIRFACPAATDEELIRALADAGLDVTSPLLPEGLETRLTFKLLDDLPESAKQAISLARCFAKPASVYLLDNAAGLSDPAGAACLTRKIAELKGRATIILATFRPTYMKMADRVIELRDGQVVAQGPWSALAERLAVRG